ncbi:HAMP domain-containing histidine kinase [Paenibacillus sp. ACRSA]|uniref:sensor histidine kinase n=1 Tax=Paenibacillus sp. ACRSA TaxID=2918211 RepID=UPI001EF61017|nr:HAMP domain-containing sensor histidine kinase [Paenibacillus sp. ACRSA]MCG7379127.1 HAMP domain-containing histidine kinase [Paenibacillus sp. ACRSA]
MKPRGIVFKLFVANLIFYIVFFAAVVAGHFWFFERFYQHERTTELGKKLASFASDYTQQKWPAEKTPTVMGSFITQNHVQMAILDTDGEVRYDNPFRIQLSTDAGQPLSIAVSFFPDMSALTAYGLQPGDRITVKGEYYVEQGHSLFSPYVIRKNGSSAVGSLPYNANREGVIEVSGTIDSVLLPAPGQWNNREGIMAAALKVWFPLPAEYNEQVNRGEAIHIEWKEPISGVHNLVFVQPILRDGKVTEYLFALTPLTQLGEAFGALEVYYAFFSITGGLLLIVVLSFLFSKMVSRPLIQLNLNAARMAKLDFTAISSIESKDELGSLSESLVSLSSNLDRTLKELQLTNEKLVLEMEYKSKMEELQKRFVSDASHELKTPISVVKGYAEGLLDQIAENKRERYIRTILREADRMEKLVLDMLELTRLEAGAVKLHGELFSVNQLALESMEKMEQLAKAKRMEIQIQGDRNVCAWADPEKIEQVLLNYLSNAIRNGTEGSPIQILIQHDVQKQNVCVSVENEGSTIAEHELSLIWDRFYREEDARSRQAGGTGLGLSIVKEIMQLHQQSYGVGNTPNGVRFYFTLDVPLEG